MIQSAPAAAKLEMYRSGFRSASLDAILSDTGVTKGALYHHFPNKTALGYAVVDEIVGHWIVKKWIEGLGQADDPITAVISHAMTLTWTRDPFDRLLVATAMLHKAPLITQDRTIRENYAEAVW